MTTTSETSHDTSEASHDTSPMRLSVTNFGPIAEAQIELRPLTVFVGPSNTGKSYMASLVYALHGSFDPYSIVLKPLSSLQNTLSSLQNTLSSLQNTPSSLQNILSSLPNTPPSIKYKTRSTRGQLSNSQMTNLISWAQQTFTSDTDDESSTAINMDAIPKDVKKIILDYINFDHSKNIRKEIERCFGIDSINNLIRYNSSLAKSTIEICNFASSADKTSININIFDNSLEFNSIFSDDFLQGIVENDVFFSSLLNSAGASDGSPDELVCERILDIISFAIVTGIIGPFYEQSYYLPADRTGIMHAHQVVMNSLIRGATFAEIRHKLNVPIISGVMGDFFEGLQTIAKNSENSELLSHASVRLENDILNGSLHSEGEYDDISCPEFTYKPNGWKKQLPLQNASSMVSELAPVILYLRHIVRPGNVLIIEEPESHLHPAKQVEFCRHLAQLVNEGLQIIITTHSEWILEALGNLVFISDLPQNQRDGLPSQNFALTREQVGVWLFKPKKRPKGSVVNEVTINSDSGNFPADYDEVMEALYGEWASTFTRLEDMKAT